MLEAALLIGAFCAIPLCGWLWRRTSHPRTEQRDTKDLSGEGIASEPRTALQPTKGSQPVADAPLPDKPSLASRKSARTPEHSSDPLWRDLHPCPICGAALRNGERVRGSYWNPEVPLDAYEAVNLLEALKLVPGTGDWHGQLRARCEAVLAKYGTEYTVPNQTAEQMSAASRRKQQS